VIELKMPSLRERQEDIPMLIRTLLARICGDRPPPELSAEAVRALCAYSYPGNVRELENILERATALCVGGKVVLDDLQLATESAVEGSIGNDAETLDDHVNRIEKQLILEALAKTGFNRTAAARLLGVTFRSLRYRIERLGIEE
jgi:two-component system response regulator PilR (NtrC family)